MSALACYRQLTTHETDLSLIEDVADKIGVIAINLAAQLERADDDCVGLFSTQSTAARRPGPIVAGAIVR